MDQKDVVVNAQLHSVGLWVDMANLIKKIASALKCSPEDLHVLDPGSLECYPEYTNTNLRDRVISIDGISELGPLEGLPSIKLSKRQGKSRIKGYGITFWEQQETKIRYATYSHPTTYEDISYIFIPKNQLYKYVRQISRFNKLACSNIVAPVLPDGMLENILHNTIHFLGKSKEIEKYGVRIKRGIILDGPPGNGKTLICRYIQKLCIEKNIRYGIVGSSEMDRAYSDQNLPDLFRRYTVTFFDDIDISYLNRKSGNGKMACSILSAMDGIDNNNHLIRIFTTNESVDSLDFAFKRPGRIDLAITIEKPKAPLRRRLIKEVWPKVIQDNIDIDKLVNSSEDWSFAELESIRSFLVTNYVVDQKWDLDLAISQHAVKKKDGVTSVGFGLGGDHPQYPEKRADFNEI